MQENTSFVVFIQFFAVLERVLKREQMSSSKDTYVRHFFISELSSLGLRLEERNTIITFMKNPVGELNVGVRPGEEHLKKAIQTVYVELCEEFGPVETDKMYGMVIDKVSKSRAAKMHPVERFL